MSNQENISKETKKTRRKKLHRKAQQIKLAVIMIMVSVLVLSASTFAWYRMSKIASVQSMEFKADTLGNLLISDEEAGTYNNTLDLSLKDNAAKLLPATTTDGKVFSMPIYNEDGDKIVEVSELTDSDVSDNIINGNLIGNDDHRGEKYVYTKEFFIKSGTNEDGTTYNLKLVQGGDDFSTGTYLKDKDGTADDYDSVNAVRVSLVVGNLTSPEKIVVFEPYNTGSGLGNRAEVSDTVKTQLLTNVNDEKTLKYVSCLVNQNDDGSWTDATKDNSVLCEIKEGVPKKITMFVWFEGMDTDCVNEIALDTVTGQLQFEAEETTQVTP